MILCPNCQHKELPGALFCSECGTQLVSLDILNTRSIQKTPSEGLSPKVNIPDVAPKNSGSHSTEPTISLHIVDSGQVLHLAERAEFTLGRTIEGQPILPDIDLSPFEAFTLGVSRLHAALRIVNREVVITDLGSSNGTRVNGQKIVPHVDYPVSHGDIIALGKLKDSSVDQQVTGEQSMSATILIHLLNEDPILAEVDELPTKTDTFIMVKNPRRKDGKDLPYLDNSVTNVIWPLARVSFIEIMPGEKDEEIVVFVRE